MSSNTEIYGESAILTGKQKVNESQQSGSSQLELNNILSAHDSKYAF